MNQDNIRIFIVDDHLVIRLGLRTLLDGSEGVLVVGEAGSLTEAYKKIEALMPEVVLLDMQLPDGDGASGCRAIKRIGSTIKVIILTAFADEPFVVEAIKAGADEDY